MDSMRRDSVIIRRPDGLARGFCRPPPPRYRHSWHVFRTRARVEHEFTRKAVHGWA
jgi:hypothetical protein